MAGVQGLVGATSNLLLCVTACLAGISAADGGGHVHEACECMPLQCDALRVLGALDTFWTHSWEIRAMHVHVCKYTSREFTLLCCAHELISKYY